MDDRDLLYNVVGYLVESDISMLEAATPTKYRERVEVYIVHGDKLVVGKKTDPRWETDIVAPGGGVDKGQTHIQAAERECLEEIGIKIKNVKKINVPPYKVDWHKLVKDGKMTPNQKIASRMRSYRGSMTFFYMAELDKIDTRLYNKNKDDSMVPTTVTIEKLEQQYRRGLTGEFKGIYVSRLKVLQQLKKQIKKSHKG